MKRLLRKGLCMALGLTCLPAAAQELNFRPATPRPATAANAEIPISLSRPSPIDSSLVPVYRAKSQDDGAVIIPVDGPPAEGVRFLQKDTPRLSPLPPGTPADFAAPPPQLLSPPSGGAFVGSGPGTIVSGPLVPGQVVSGPIGPGAVVSGPMSSSGCACSSGGYSVLDGFIGDDPVGCGSCGNACAICDSHWYPFQHVHDFFACACNNGCCAPRTPLWFRAEYLLWNVTQQNVPPLATQFAGGAGNFTGLPLGAGGAVLYDSNNINNAVQNGVRLGLGFWFPRHDDWGMDASYFFLGNRTGAFTNSSDGSIATGRPFINNNPNNPKFGQNDAEIVAATNPAGTLLPGSIAINTSTQIWGVDANLRHKLCCGPTYWIDGLIGYRHLQLQDYVNITENVGPIAGGANFNGSRISADRFTVNDYFGTNNAFNGAQVGLEAEWRFRPRLTLGGTFKFAAGDMHQNVLINGFSTIQGFNGNPSAMQTQPGGLLAQGTNIGSHAVDRFAVIPELGLRFGWDITQHWRFYAGYNILYVSSVMRAGEQIDPRVNTSQFAFTGPAVNGVPGPGVLAPGTPPTPAVLMKTTDFWAQGVSFGLEYRY